jgi:hypothetical protein
MHLFEERQHAVKSCPQIRTSVFTELRFFTNAPVLDGWHATITEAPGTPCPKGTIFAQTDRSDPRRRGPRAVAGSQSPYGAIGRPKPFRCGTTTRNYPPLHIIPLAQAQKLIYDSS